MKKNIVIIHQNMVMGGVEKVTLNLLKNLDRNKFNIKFILVEKYGELLKEIPKDIKVNYLLDKNYTKNKNLLTKIIGYIKELGIIRLGLRKIINKDDIILSMNMRNLRLNISLLNLKNKKVGWIHTTILADNFINRKIKIQNFLWKQFNIIFNVSKQGKEDFDLLFPNLQEKSKVLYNSFNIENFRNKSNENPLKIDNYLFSVGRIVNSHKGFNILIDAIKLLKDEGFDEKLYLVGEGTDKEKIKLQIKELNLEENVKLVGFDDNPYRWMKNAKMFIMSSNHEGLPTVLIEALACETPIVSTDCKCGPKEILKNGENGILVPVGNSYALKDGIKKILLDKNLRAKFKKNSLRRACDFSNKKILKELENSLENL